MKHGAVGRQAECLPRPKEARVLASPSGSMDRYDLATALRIVRRMETSTTRSAVFEEIKNKNPLYRLVDGIYSSPILVALQPIFLCTYMLKSILSIGPAVGDDDKIVAISNFGNEHHAVEVVAGLLPDVGCCRLSLRRLHFFSRGQLRATVRLLGAMVRLWPFLSVLARSQRFMPAARISSALAFYVRFLHLFADKPGLTAALIASNYSPEAVGMAAAAHRKGRHVIYTNHAPVPANGALIPPVLADCAVFYGEATRQIYEQRSRCSAEVILVGQPWTARAMEWRDEIRTVGIFLTALTRTDVVSELVASIRKSHPDVRILVRNHPVALLKADLSELAANDAKIEITIGNSLDDEIAACEIVVCGNSGVAMNVLSGGRPVAYMNSLDGLNFDYNGFVERGLTCPVEGWGPNIYQQLKDFYDTPRWLEVMRSYDASYGADVIELRRKAGATIKRYVRPKADCINSGCEDAGQHGLGHFWKNCN